MKRRAERSGKKFGSSEVEAVVFTDTESTADAQGVFSFSNAGILLTGNRSYTLEVAVEDADGIVSSAWAVDVSP